MKRISFLWLAALLVGAPISRADDAAVEERLNKLGGQIEDLLAAAAKQDKRLSALERELESVREQAARPSGNYASQDDVRKLWEKLQEIDQKRLADNERIVKEIEKLAKVPAGGGTRTPKPPRPSAEDPGKTGGPTGGGLERGFEYVIAPGDSLSAIVLACKKDKGLKVTVDQILKANPGLKERNLQPGQKIFIPAPSEK